MELRHLRYFIAVAEEENVSRAALKLHVSQPGISRQIRDLEEEIGFSLLERSAKSVRLTETRVVLQHAAEAVTGASKGIGASIAKQLATDDASVVVNYASSKAGADKVVAEITTQGGMAVAVQGDVAKKVDIDRLFNETKKAFGRLDILMNNAGIYEFAPLEQITEEHFHKQFNLNVLGLILTTQEA